MNAPVNVLPSSLELTQAELHRLFHYDGETGVFTRLVTVPGGRSKAGTIAGTRRKNGYLTIGINNREYYCHRLAWFYVHGWWPPKSTDHINGNKVDNRIANLRCAAQWQNAGNQAVRRGNASGVKGVSWHPQCQKWVARLSAGGRTRYLGIFTSIEEARAAYAVAAEEYFGDFARVA